MKGALDRRHGVVMIGMGDLSASNTHDKQLMAGLKKEDCMSHPGIQRGGLGGPTIEDPS